MRYEEYMQSAEWKALRGKCIRRAGGKCEFCGGAAVSAHHVRYPKNGYENDKLANLVAVCWRCQELSHGIRRGHGGGVPENSIVDQLFTRSRCDYDALRSEIHDLVVGMRRDYDERLEAIWRDQQLTLARLQLLPAVKQIAGHITAKPIEEPT